MADLSARPSDSLLIFNRLSVSAASRVKTFCLFTDFYTFALRFSSQQRKIVRPYLPWMRPFYQMSFVFPYLNSGHEHCQPGINVSWSCQKTFVNLQIRVGGYAFLRVFICFYWLYISILIYFSLYLYEYTKTVMTKLLTTGCTSRAVTPPVLLSISSACSASSRSLHSGFLWG